VLGVNSDVTGAVAQAHRERGRDGVILCRVDCTRHSTLPYDAAATGAVTAAARTKQTYRLLVVIQRHFSKL
jgi:hypothetical protein